MWVDNLFVPKALLQALEIHVAFDLQDTPAMLESQSLLKQAKVTKCTACLLHCLLTTENKAVLRTQIQMEIKGLRSEGVNEKEHLHPLVMHQCNLALAMRA